MRSTPYYSVRTGEDKLTTNQLDLATLKRLFLEVYTRFNNQDYFQQAFGYYCVDSGQKIGTVGSDIEALLVYKMGKKNIWPIGDHIQTYTEYDLLDIIEFCFDCIAKPVAESGYYHDWNQCGWHYEKFDKLAGQTEFREEVNKYLLAYETPYELSAEGNVLKPTDLGLEKLMEAAIPTQDIDNVKLKLERAILKFRHFKSTLEDKRHVLKELADILEYLRPEAKKFLEKADESDLFNIANNFGIRHHNLQQKTNFDKSIWYNWIFYYYLATIHALLRFVTKHADMKI